MNPRIPPLLSSHLQDLSRDSLILLSGVINANTTWLVLRYLHSALVDHDGRREISPRGKSNKVILVSWIREWEFWKSEARRAIGLDLVKQAKDQRIVFIDGLTQLFSQNSPSSGAQESGAKNSRSDGQQPNLVLQNPTLKELSSNIEAAVLHLVQTTISSGVEGSDCNILLILDVPSILLQTSLPAISSTSLLSAILTFRQNLNIYSTVVSVPTDGPLLGHQTRGLDLDFRPAFKSGIASLDQSGTIHTTTSLPAPLETENAAFSIALAHQSDLVLSCRMLGTGFAEDVSGVIRATRGGTYPHNQHIEEGEWLYYIGRDGSAKVWARGGLDGG